MNKEKIKLIIHNLELLLTSLKEELNNNDIFNPQYEEVASYIEDYDEIFYDDED
jgi:hypothetical protein